MLKTIGCGLGGALFYSLDKKSGNEKIQQD